MCAVCVKQAQNQERAVSWATWLKSEFRGHLVNPQPPTFYGFQASESPNETPRPPYQWSLGAARGQPSRRIVGANGGSTRVPRAQKRFVSKLFLDHLGCSNKCVWPVLSLWWRVLGHGKSQNALKMRRFETNNGSKMGQKMHFYKSDLGPFVMLKQLVSAHFEPVVTCFRPWKIPKCLEIRLFWDRKWLKNGSKTRFSISDPRPFGMLKQVF